MARSRTTINLPPELHKKLLHVVVDLRTTLTSFVAKAIEEKIARIETEHLVFKSLNEAIQGVNPSIEELKQANERIAVYKDPVPPVNLGDFLPCLYCGRIGCQCRK